MIKYKIAFFVKIIAWTCFDENCMENVIHTTSDVKRRFDASRCP